MDFLPKKAGHFKETLTFFSEQEEEDVKIVLEGGAYTAHITLNQINGQKISEQKFHNSLYLNNC